VTAGLCILQLILYPAYVAGGWSTTAPRKQHADILAHEIRRGVPLHELVKRHSGFFFASDEYLELQLRRLHNAQIGIFAEIQIESRTANAEAPPKE
jgi:hypothetical protein